MHFQMKIQPIDNQTYAESIHPESTMIMKPVLKSRFKRLFDRQFQFSGVLKNSSEKVNDVKDREFEPSSVCLDKMVQNFIEDTAYEKPKCGRSRCNCFNGNINDVYDDEFDLSGCGIFGETLKSLTPCASVIQRNLLADTSKIVEKNKICKRKDELRKLVVEELQLIGYDASICKSHWEKSSSYPAGEYEYIDVIFEDEEEEEERVIMDIDFRSEFEIARPTGNYKAILQSLPYIFVGESDRLQQIISIVTESAKQSLKKKGMHVPPWRKFEYMKSKWLSPYTRTPPSSPPSQLPLLPPPTPPPTPDANAALEQKMFSSPHPVSKGGVFELVFGEETTSLETSGDGRGESDEGIGSPAGGRWEPPARNVERGSRLVVTGLASLFQRESFKE